MSGIAVELRALVASKRVFDRQLVQCKLARKLVQVLFRRAVEVHPDDRAGFFQVFRDVGDGEALSLQNPLAVYPGLGVTHQSRPSFSLNLPVQRA